MLCLMAKRLELDQGAYPQRPVVFLEGTMHVANPQLKVHFDQHSQDYQLQKHLRLYLSLVTYGGIRDIDCWFHSTVGSPPSASVPTPLHDGPPHKCITASVCDTNTKPV